MRKRRGGLDGQGYGRQIKIVMDPYPLYFNTLASGFKLSFISCLAASDYLRGFGSKHANAMIPVISTWSKFNVHLAQKEKPMGKGQERNLVSDYALSVTTVPSVFP